MTHWHLVNDKPVECDGFVNHGICAKTGLEGWASEGYAKAALIRKKREALKRG